MMQLPPFITKDGGPKTKCCEGITQSASTSPTDLGADKLQKGDALCNGIRL